MTQSASFALDAKKDDDPRRKESLQVAATASSASAKNGLFELVEKAKARVLIPPSPSAFPQLLRLPDWQVGSSVVAEAFQEAQDAAKTAEVLSLSKSAAAVAGKKDLAKEAAAEEALARDEAQTNAARAAAVAAQAEAQTKEDGNRERNSEEKACLQRGGSLRGAGVHASNNSPTLLRVVASGRPARQPPSSSSKKKEKTALVGRCVCALRRLLRLSRRQPKPLDLRRQKLKVSATCQ